MNIAPEYLSTGFGEFGGKLIAVIFGNLVPRYDRSAVHFSQVGLVGRFADVRVPPSEMLERVRWTEQRCRI